MLFVAINPVNSHLKFIGIWKYPFIHVAVNIKDLQQVKALSKRFHLAESEVQKILDFLVECNLISLKGQRYIPAKDRIHLGLSSAHLSRHHTNVKVRALENSVLQDPRNIHYSSVLTLSKKDFLSLKSEFLGFLESFRCKIAASVTEEDVYCLSMDFFKA